MRQLVVAARAQTRIAEALDWLAERPGDAPVVIVAETLEAAAELCRTAVASRAPHSVFGWQAITLSALAWRLACVPIASRRAALAPPLSREALCARAIARTLGEGRLGALAVIAERPGFPRALARTLTELGMAGVEMDRLAGAAPELAALQAAYRAELAQHGMVDRADVFREAAAHGGALEAASILLFDVALSARREVELVEALCRDRAAVLATAARGDERSIVWLERALGVARSERAETAADALSRLQQNLFGGAPEAATLDDSVRVLSTPGESREAVEIARAALAEAARGVPFDRMAVIARSPEDYGDHLAEAFERAGIPAHFTHGMLRPDPSGRALLSLLTCRAEHLSARRFAEYLSLGVAPQPTDEGAPPPRAAPGAAWSAPAHDMASPPDDDAEAPSPTGASPALPRQWERLLTDAYVIQDRARWPRRLRGLRAALELERDALDPDHARRDAIGMRLEALASLEQFALPLIDELSALPERGPWSLWLDRIAALATRALRAPARVLAVLAELAPLGDVGPVQLDDVLWVLTPRLSELHTRPGRARAGKLLVASAEEVRGLSFEVVFIPGLAEKIFPKKVIEDPLALDAVRRALSSELAVNTTRIAAERTALRLAVGAATQRVVLSYPRVDVERSRPRVPSFYGLEVLRAAEGALPGFDELGRRAEQGAAERMGWPAPRDPMQAIDDAEFDLAVLDELLHARDARADVQRGRARYLMGANPHLARAIRFRALRWKPAWTVADGILRPNPLAREALRAHEIGVRAYSPTALERFAVCPYQFFLAAIAKLSPRERIVAVEELDALQRGRLIHEVQQAVLRELRARGALPVTRDTLSDALAVARARVAAIAAAYHDRLAPAIERVWRDSIDEIEADVCEWLERQALDPSWQPLHFELGFGLPPSDARDAASRPEDVVLSSGLRLRGAIDLVEQRGDVLRATDHKTGRARVLEGAVAGGKSLQPLLYALALEQLTGREVVSGRLYYCTRRGDFREHEVPLEPATRAVIDRVATIIGEHLRQAQLVAAPEQGACRYCDYRVICGPREEERAGRKVELPQLTELRSLR